MAEVLVEHVDWKREEIRHTALRIVSFYTLCLSRLGTSRWIDFAARMIPVVMAERGPAEVSLHGDAFELVFIPPKPTLAPHIREKMIVWEEREPRLVFFDDTFTNLAAGYRNLIYGVNEAIAQEVSEVYKVSVHKDPVSFIFPKNEYGKVAIERAVLIGER
ncbi:hypothetical protein HYT18_05010 [Candidatus Microgenomates bacterium]|nr:hypothetical protein [Candidatus Microgenomates bacterium]